ncbi:MAG: histone-like protein [Candidatus Hodarchaeota archaeon]
MPKIKGKDVILGFSDKECRQLLKKTGIRVSKDSVNALNKLLTRRAREIATKAVTLAEDNNREVVKKDDITRAVQMTSAIATFEVGLEAPVVHYVWFISSGGTCLLSRSYSGLMFPDTIFSGLLTGILDLFGEVTGRKIDKFTTDDLNIHIRRIRDITVAVISDSIQSEPINELTELLARRFYQVFAKELEQEVIDTSIFDDFTPVLDALVSSAGLKIPRDRLKVIKSGGALTDRQLEETVDAVALRQELKRAQEFIQELDVFKKVDNLEAVEHTKVVRMLDEPPDVKEIKAVLRKASQDIREEFNGDTQALQSETPSKDISREEILAEIISDFPEVSSEKKSIKEAQIKSEKKPKKKTKRRRKRRRK